jgi:predicted dehydrogenase
MAEQVRVGVVGTNNWNDLVHLPSLRTHPGAALAAICGRNRDKGAALAKKYDIPQVFTDYREMIEKGGLDAVVISSPDDLHYPMTMEALDAGLHVLCEKPIALNAQHAWQMYEKAEAAGVKHMVFFTWHWLPHFRYIKRLIDEGYIGRCYHIQFNWIRGSARKGTPDDWHFDRKRSNGILGDLGSHLAHLANWYVGDISAVSSQLGTLIPKDSEKAGRVNDSAMLTIEFANGAQGMIHMSNAAHVAERGQEQRLTFHGEGGTLESEFYYRWPDAPKPQLRGARHDEDHFQSLIVPDDLWGDADRSIHLQMGVFNSQSVGGRMFIDAILQNKPIHPDFLDGWKAQRVTDAAFESAETGCRVRLD